MAAESFPAFSFDSLGHGMVTGDYNSISTKDIFHALPSLMCKREDRGWKIDIKRSETHKVKIPRPFTELWGLFIWVKNFRFTDEQGNDSTDSFGNRVTGEQRNGETVEQGNIAY